MLKWFLQFFFFACYFIIIWQDIRKYFILFVFVITCLGPKRRPILENAHGLLRIFCNCPLEKIDWWCNLTLLIFFSGDLYHLLPFHQDEISWKKELEKEQLILTQFQGIVHHGGEVMVAGAWGCCSHCICQQEAESDACLLSGR